MQEKQPRAHGPLECVRAARARDAPHCRVVPRRWPERDGQKVAQEDQGAVRRDVSILLIPLARRPRGGCDQDDDDDDDNDDDNGDEHDDDDDDDDANL